MTGQERRVAALEAAARDDLRDLVPPGLSAGGADLLGRLDQLGPEDLPALCALEAEHAMLATKLRQAED